MRSLRDAQVDGMGGPGKSGVVVERAVERVPEAIITPAQMPFPNVNTGAIPTSVMAQDRGPTFDHPS